MFKTFLCTLLNTVDGSSYDCITIIITNVQLKIIRYNTSEGSTTRDERIIQISVEGY